jgi:hypothetical protein
VLPGVFMIEALTQAARAVLEKRGLARMVLGKELKTPLAVVDYFAARFLAVPLAETTRQQLAATFEQELGSADVLASATVLEEPLRVLLHLMLSRPEYQLG